MTRLIPWWHGAAVRMNTKDTRLHCYIWAERKVITGAAEPKFDSVQGQDIFVSMETWVDIFGCVCGVV